MRTIIGLVTTACGAILVAACSRHAPAALPADAALRALPAVRHVRPSTMALPPGEILRLLESKPFELRDVKRAEAGVTGVSRATAHFPQQGLDLPVKWAPAPATTIDGWDASPRKEIAAFAVQELFLGPDDWVVPPTTMRCLPFDALPRTDAPSKPTIAGTRCVLGLVAAWLQHVKPPDVLYDPERFAHDRAYAERLADLNLLTYLIEHRDARSGNILVSEDPNDWRVYAVDNGIAFGNLVWNYFVANWDVLRVPALRRVAIDRLRHVTQTDLEALLVVRELRIDTQRMLQPAPPGAPLDRTTGARVRGNRVQLGLTADEVAGVATRLQQLLARVDAGEIPTF